MTQSVEKNILVLDEPALHLHPLKIKRIQNILIKSNKQIILITHSPYFVSTQLFQKNCNLLNVNIDKNGCSQITDKGKNNELQLFPKHHFQPEIFFSKCNVFLEGPSDVSSLGAISDYFNDIFEKKEILLINAGGKDLIDKYVKIIETYNLNHIVMVDNDYRNENRKTTDKFIILSKRLEDELIKLNPKLKSKLTKPQSDCKSKSVSVKPNDAYTIVINAMKKNKAKVRKSKLGYVFNSIIENVGLKGESYWKKYH
jgi:predicted ATP-dependent endonuclease of OLD family